MRQVARWAITLLAYAGAGGAAAQPLGLDLKASGLTGQNLSGDLSRAALNSAVVRRNLERAGLGADRFDVPLVSLRPKVVSFATDTLEFDLAPHAGFGVSRFGGGQAEGGATLMVSKSRGERALEKLRDMGVKEGTSFGDAGRWYLFAAASGQAVGLNMTRDEHGWDRAGWSTDPTGALVGDAQIGVGWRKGDLQSSFGVVHREVKGRHMIFGQQTRDDTMAAFTFSLRPR